jgi:CheY-like chemotaxis protein
MPHKLLLADDSVTIQRVIELTFADEDVQVQAVGDGMRAIASIEADRPDIVLADVGMPERDGYEVAAFIKGNPQLAHIPVLLLTGAFEPVDEARARAVGCDGVLVKPFEPQMVINRVKDLLAGRRPAGLWGQTQGTAAPMGRQAPAAQADRDPRGTLPSEGAAGSSGSLEDYFDRLDAAFANLDPAPAADGPAMHVPPPTPPSTPAFAPIDDFAGWDPDLAGDPARAQARPAPPIAPTVASPPVAPPVASPPAAPAVAPPPAQPLSAPPAAAPPAPAMWAPAAPSSVSPTPAAPSTPLPSLADAFAALLSAEQSVQVAPSRITAGTQVGEDVIDEVVRRVVAKMGDTVLEAAERLVREEIDRIKRG